MIIGAILGCTAMTGLLGYTFIDHGGLTEGSKIQRIANRSGLVVKADGKTHTIHLLRRQRHPWGMEYVYRIPLGLTFEDFQKKKQNIEDGLNHKRGLSDITFDDLKSLRFGPDLLQQIKKLLSGTKQRKEVLLSYDGTLKIRIYKEAMPEMYAFDGEILACCKGWSVCIGYARENIVYHDFDKIPHLVVAGTTRYGKSVFLKNVITTLINSNPNTVKLTLLDLKGGLAFNRYANAKQVIEVAADVKESLAALQRVHAAILIKQKDYRRRGVEDIKEAKEKERHFIVIDEAAELASKGEGDPVIKKMKIDCEHIIAEIARIGGGLGYRLIFATQYPTADTLPRQVKQNCDARLCFRLQTDVASQVVLDEAGAEQLPLIKGRGIYQTDRKMIVQTPFIENDFIDRTIKPHIVIKPRREPAEHEHNPAAEDATGGSYTLVIKEA